MSYHHEKSGLIPVAPIRRVVEQWAKENWWIDERQVQSKGKKTASLGTTALLAEKVGCHEDTIYHLRAGRNTWIDFDLADRIVTCIDPWLWRTDEELSELYQSFDLSFLDILRPPSAEADDLPLLDFLSQRHAAAILGVNQRAVSKQREKRQKEAA